MKLTELIKSKLNESETEEDAKLRAAAGVKAGRIVEEVVASEDPDHPGALVRRYHKVTQGTMVLRAHAAGHTWFSKVTLSKIVNDGLKAFPMPDTIFAIAAALRVTPEKVTAATAEEFGIFIHQPDDPNDPVVLTKGRRRPSEVGATRRRIARTLDAQTGQPADGVDSG